MPPETAKFNKSRSGGGCDARFSVAGAHIRRRLIRIHGVSGKPTGRKGSAEELSAGIAAAAAWLSPRTPHTPSAPSQLCRSLLSAPSGQTRARRYMYCRAMNSFIRANKGWGYIARSYEMKNAASEKDWQVDCAAVQGD